MSSLFNNLSINRKLSLVILSISAIVLLLAGTAMIVTEVFTARRATLADIAVLADVLGRNSAAALAFHRDEDAEELDKMLSALAADQHIQVACVYDKSGGLFGKYTAQGSTLPTPAGPPLDGSRIENGLAEIAVPITMEDRRIGTIYLRSDLNRIYHQIYLHGIIIALTLLGIIILTFALSPRLQKPISEPILALAAVAQRVAARKDYAARAVKQNDDEVGLLTDAFNQMLGEIETAQTSLQRANASMQSEIDERKAVEEQLRSAHDDVKKARDIAEAASRSKDQFLAVLSHELRTPLTPVLLTATLLQNRTDLPPDALDDVQTIRRHVELEARLIDDLLDLTRITRGKMQLTFETVDAHVLLRDALTICCSDRMDDVRIHLDAALHHVRADSGRLLQIFWNLLNNAAKFTRHGSPIDLKTSNTPDGKIRIEVIDQGVGIEPAALPKIFNAFEQGDASFIRSFGGLGLGLTIAKALVDAHGGTISAFSKGRDAGASFVIELATVPAPAKPVSVHPASQAPTSRVSLRLLVVEDHVGTLKLMTKLLTGEGHTVQSAGTVKGALEIAKNTDIDLVISDIGLPDGDGVELMRQLRDLYGLKGICLSGFGMEEDVLRSRDAGFVQHLTKPVDIRKLETAIQDAISRLP